MLGLSLSDAASVAQIVLAFVGVIGLAVTLVVALLTIREVKKDRALRHRPYLAFEQGGCPVPVEFVNAGKSIPGVNPAYVAKVLPNLPGGALSVRPLDRGSRDFGIGRLTNFGVGPALHTSVTWIPNRLTIGTDSFQIDAQKLSEPVYSRELNTMPSFRAHIAPNTTTFLTRLPTFIEKDIEKKISEVEGVLEIKCKDIFHSEVTTRQAFYIRTGYKETPPEVHITFRGLLPPVEERADAPSPGW